MQNSRLCNRNIIVKTDAVVSISTYIMPLKLLQKIYVTMIVVKLGCIVVHL